jgi:hypothetical protein
MHNLLDRGGQTLVACDIAGFIRHGEWAVAVNGKQGFGNNWIIDPRKSPLKRLSNCGAVRIRTNFR